MRIRAFLLSIAISGCGLVSGLDALRTSDAAADATSASDDASDASLAPDVPIDAGASADVIACGTTACAVGTICCVASATSTNQYSCVNGTCSGAVALHCDDKSDCPSGDSCCFSTSGNTATATCVGSAIACTSLCTGDGQCGVKCVPFDAGYGLSLSKCE